MTKKRTAKQMQNDLGELFDRAKTEGNLKVAAYICQVWLSSRAAVAEEEQEKRNGQTSIDRLVKELALQRKTYAAQHPEHVAVIEE
jgi:hypothetical protein